MHISVLLEEAIKYLELSEDKTIVDCTLGYGGHSSEILKKINKGFLFAFDQDRDAIEFSNKRLSDINSNYEIIKSNFKYIKEELNKRGITRVDGILFDLGVSSPQLDEADRGFSFHEDAKLDMRMDKDSDISAWNIVNEYSYQDMVRIFRNYGEEKFATSIARKIESYRKNKTIDTTLELVEIIKSAVSEKYKREKHPARKVFQAIRIEVNKELEVFETALRSSLDLIKVGGRVCVITFHSLEDRLCKQLFKEVSSVDKNIAKLPIIPEEFEPKFKLIANDGPTDKELEQNNRSRSARIRVIEKIKE